MKTGIRILSIIVFSFFMGSLSAQQGQGTEEFKELLKK